MSDILIISPGKCAIAEKSIRKQRMAKQKKYWLMKSEPDCYSIDDLKRDKTTYWDGVRNYQARNFMRDQMQLGDEVLFYHSNADPPAIVGVATIAKEAYPDFTAFDPNDPHYDPKSNQQEPRWMMVDLKFKSKFSAPLGLDQLRKIPALTEMELLRKGSRLSVQPVRKTEFETVLKLAAKAG
jgi:predicted RNA-binding protein with PUA-like domain